MQEAEERRCQAALIARFEVGGSRGQGTERIRKARTRQAAPPPMAADPLFGGALEKGATARPAVEMADAQLEALGLRMDAAIGGPLHEVCALR